MIHIPPYNEKIKYFKRSVVISKKQLEECQYLLKLLGIPVINAPEEADSQCAYLVKEKIAQKPLMAAKIPKIMLIDVEWSESTSGRNPPTMPIPMAVIVSIGVKNG